MDDRAPLPWVLSWDANGELEIHDRFDLLLSDPVLEKACLLAVPASVPLQDLSPSSSPGSGGWLPWSIAPAPETGPDHPGSAARGTDR